MESGKIKDSQITVSSSILTFADGRSTRLHNDTEPLGAWCPSRRNGRSYMKYDEYIQIDLLDLMRVTQVATQGRTLNGGMEYAKNFKISSSSNGRKWVDYVDEDHPERLTKVLMLSVIVSFCCDFCYDIVMVVCSVHSDNC